MDSTQALDRRIPLPATGGPKPPGERRPANALARHDRFHAGSAGPALRRVGADSLVSWYLIG